MSSYAGFWFLIQSTGGWWNCRQSQCTIVIIGGTVDNVTMLYCPHRWVVQVMMLKHLEPLHHSIDPNLFVLGLSLVFYIERIVHTVRTPMHHSSGDQTKVMMVGWHNQRGSNWVTCFFPHWAPSSALLCRSEIYWIAFSLWSFLVLVMLLEYVGFCALSHFS